MNGYTPDVNDCRNSGLLKTVTRVSTIRERRAFKHLQRVYGLTCSVWFPRSGEYDPHTRTGSLYNREDNKYRYPEEPNIECINFVISNLMSLTRLDAQTRMDQLMMGDDIYAYTDRLGKDGLCLIPPESKIIVHYNFKEFTFFAWEITALDSPHTADGKAIYRIKLRSHV